MKMKETKRKEEKRKEEVMMWMRMDAGRRKRRERKTTPSVPPSAPHIWFGTVLILSRPGYIAGRQRRVDRCARKTFSYGYIRIYPY